MAASLWGLGLLLAGTVAQAQQSTPPEGGPRSTWKPADQVWKSDLPGEAPTSPSPKKTISYHKEPGAAAPTAVQPAAFQNRIPPPSGQGMTGPYASTAGESDLITLVPPGFERVFGRLESEASFNERIRQAARNRDFKDRTVFPEQPIISTEPFRPRSFPPHQEIVEPNFVAHDLLLFEQKNFERHGWDLGILSPIASASKFYCDFVTLPYHLASQIGRGPDASAGKCLPGDPVPLLLYPPEINLTAGIVETATIVGLIAIFP
jgi:hypothetical protein